MDSEPETLEAGATISNPDESDSSKNEVTLSCDDELLSQPSTSKGKSKKTTNKRALPIKGKKPKKSKELPEKDEVETLLMGLSKDIDSVLEETAQRNQLTAINVKNILRHVITNEDVLAMVWNTMKLEDGQGNIGESELSAVYEQKLTRSTVRKLCGADAVPAKPPISCDPITKKLLEEEFSENESSDEEYRPVSSIVDEDTDEETKSKGKKQVPDSPTTPVTILPFEELSEDASLHIAEDELLASEDEDKIALRTRSKLPLNDTLLESIEAAFMAPDITTDMYDSECDDEDWRGFLGDFLKPVAATTIEEDDDGEDPEYNFLEEEDVTDEWDLRNDRAVKVSKKELNDLVAELIEATDQDFTSPGEEDTDEMGDSMVSPPLSITDVRNKAKEQSKISFFELITPEIREVLDEQMRMHVQLLAQMGVLCSGEPTLKTYRLSAQTLLLELKGFAGKALPYGQRSAFSAHNLKGAIDLVFSNVQPSPLYIPQSKCKIRKEIPRNVQKMIARSQTFIYPELLPVHALVYPEERGKLPFILPEDHLLALGLEQFSSLKGFNHSTLIRTYLLPTRTEQQIRVRIKNVKRAKQLESNPIKYYFQHNKAPDSNVRVQPFDPDGILAPCDRPSDQVPTWLKRFVPLKKMAFVSISPNVKKQTLNMSPAPKTPPLKSLRARYNPILPRYESGLSRSVKSVSPLKQITPILKKYVYRSGRVLSRGPLRLSFSPSKKITPGGITCRPNRPLAPKVTPEPKPVSEKEVGQPVKTPIAVEQQISISKDTSSVNTRLKQKEKEQAMNVPAITTTDSVTNDSIVFEESAEKVNGLSENPSASETENCDEPEDLDNEGDLQALMVASSTICKKHQSLTRKKNKQQRDLETGLALLAPDIFGSDPLRDSRETHFAYTYLEKVKENLRDDLERYGIFLQTLSEFDGKTKSVMQLFDDIRHIFNTYPDLVSDFTSFLTPEQAFQCGRLEENQFFSKVQTFLRKMEIYQPHQIQKFLRVLSALLKENNLTSQLLFSSIQPFLRNQSHLMEEFSRLFLHEEPPASMMTDFEDITIPDSDAESMDEDMVEEFELPDSEDIYGSKQCPCTCHTDTTDPRMQSCNKHCVKCGLKFIDGRIFLQLGKGLKPAQVIYHTEDKESNSTKNTQPTESPLSSLSPVTDHTSSQEEEEGTKDSAKKTTLPVPEQVRIRNTRETIAACSNICGMETIEMNLPASTSFLQGLNEVEGGVEIYDPFALAMQQVIHEDGADKETIAEQYGLSFSNPCRAPWSKEEDKCLLETCQRFGATDKAFTEVTTMLTERKLEDVKHRFLELMSLFTVHGNIEDSEESE